MLSTLPVDRSIFLHWSWPLSTLKCFSKRENVFANVLEVCSHALSNQPDFYFGLCLLAAAKLANATRTQKSVMPNNHHADRQTRPRHQQPFHECLGSAITHPTNSSLKYSASNGSCLDQCSTDDVEDVSCSKMECLNILPSSGSKTHQQSTAQHHQPHALPGPRSDLSTSQISLTFSVDESKILPISKLNREIRDVLSCPS